MDLLNYQLPPHREFRDARALVVEDNEFLRKLATKVLGEIGIVDTHWVRTPGEGLMAFRQRPANAVLVEFGHHAKAAARMMTRIGNSEFGASGATGVIALSPSPDLTIVLRAQACGAEAVVAEPFSPKQLAEHIETIVQRHMHPEMAIPLGVDRTGKPT